MKQIELKIKNKEGLHARPAMQFVEKAMEFKSKISVRKKDKFYSAKSMMAVLSIGAVPGDTITLVAEGDDEEIAIQALERLVSAELV